MKQTNRKNDEREARHLTIIEICFLVILVLCTIVYVIVFVMGQLYANIVIAETGKAIKEAVLNGNSSAIDYDAAIHYIEMAQQAYSESNATNMTSIVYGLITAVILSYGARMLRLGAEDRDKLRELENDSENKLKSFHDAITLELSELAKTTSDDIKETGLKLTDMTKSSFMNYNNVYIATTSCQHAAHTCTLLQSHITLLGKKDIDIPDIVWQLHVYFIRSLTTFCDFMNQYSNFSNETLRALDHSWNLAKPSLRSYIGLDSSHASAEIICPDDLDLLREIYNQIERRFKSLRDVCRNDSQTN